jgi:thiol:disulfide interchange protein DsbC
MTAFTTSARRAPAIGRPSQGGALPVVLALVAGLAIGAAGMLLAGRIGAPPAAPSASSGVSASTAAPGEAAIRETLAARIPDLPKIDEVTSTPIAGVFEVRIGSDVIYSDERGAFLLQGSLIDTATRTNLTQERLDKLSAIDFASLPLDDAIVWTQGSGTRKVAVFADPLCGFCKRFEQQLGDAKDVTVYTFLLPILGPESAVKSRNIWCAKDRAKAWNDWILDAKKPAAAKCDSEVVDRNVELGRKLKINGTPTIFLADGRRLGGYLPAAELEQVLQSVPR